MYTQRLQSYLKSLFMFSLIASVTIMTADSIQAQMADGNSKYVGNILDNENIPSNFNNYWNAVTPENHGKWEFLEPTQGQWNWGPLTAMYDYAQQNGFLFRQHAFVWGAQEPGWVEGSSQGMQYGALEYFMTEYGNRFPDTDHIDVVNEPLHDPPSYTAALGGSGATGWDWVITSFEMARQTNPNAQLHINEYGIINNPNLAQQYVEIINLLNDRGLIDGIGIQCHAFSMDDVTVGTMNQVLDMLASTGLPIYVTELDMRGSDALQLQRYQEKFPVLYEHPAVQGVTIWGYREGVIWMEGAHLLRSNGSERPALEWLGDYLSGSPGGGGPAPGGDSNPTGSGSNEIVVRAVGTSGAEQIRLNVGGSTIATWSISSNWTNYTAYTNATGDVNVELINDQGPGYEAQIEYVDLNGDRRYSVDQGFNTSAWDGECGAGEFTMWMHCNGMIGYGDLTPGSGGANTILIRAVGTSGNEQLRLNINNNEVVVWNITSSWQNYSVNTNETGHVNIELINDQGPGYEAQVEYMELNGERRYAADQSYNTSAWDGECGGGEFTMWMHCNGMIGFGDVPLNVVENQNGVSNAEQMPSEFKLASAYPNPFNPVTQIGYDVPVTSSVTLVVYDALGREVQRLVDGTVNAGSHNAFFDAGNQPSGVYFYRLSANAENGQHFLQTGKMTLVK